MVLIGIEIRCGMIGFGVLYLIGGFLLVTIDGDIIVIMVGTTTIVGTMDSIIDIEVLT
tara:strand:- start:276 stop:449 length:174 start_codon:yes stop_codon:yes gene_type:complete